MKHSRQYKINISQLILWHMKIKFLKLYNSNNLFKICISWVFFPLCEITYVLTLSLFQSHIYLMKLVFMIRDEMVSTCSELKTFPKSLELASWARCPLSWPCRSTRDSKPFWGLPTDTEETNGTFGNWKNSQYKDTIWFHISGYVVRAIQKQLIL